MPLHEWNNNFRMSKDDFFQLVEIIRPYARERSSKVRKDVITLEKRLAITLYYLKDQGSMKMTANVFGVAQCTVGQVVHEMCKILSENIGPKMIKFPSDKDEVMQAISEFHTRFGFPKVIGCVDGTHIPIKAPSENTHDYFSYKMCYSVNVQAICDAFGRFINVEVKWPGSVHDARVFSNCQVQKSFVSGKFSLFYTELLSNCECVPQLILGDPAYPLLPYLMKEYEHCITNEHVIFNQLLRSARNQIECAFGRLKARWRILQRPLDIPIKLTPKVIYACFVLHNYCEQRKVDVDSNLVEQIINAERRNVAKADKIYSSTTTAGVKVRDTIADYFKQYL